MSARNDRKMWAYDIALVFLPVPFNISGSVNTICLPSQGQVFQGMATIAGWGVKHDDDDPFHAAWAINGTLTRTASVNILKQKACYDSAVRVSVKLILCASLPNHMIGSCRGDSGGPLMVRLGSRDYAIGIVSGSDCYVDTTTVFVRVSQWREWIERKIKKKLK